MLWPKMLTYTPMTTNIDCYMWLLYLYCLPAAIKADRRSILSIFLLGSFLLVFFRFFRNVTKLFQFSYFMTQLCMCVCMCVCTYVCVNIVCYGQQCTGVLHNRLCQCCHQFKVSDEYGYRSQLVLTNTGTQGKMLLSTL